MFGNQKYNFSVISNPKMRIKNFLLGLKVKIFKNLNFLFQALLLFTMNEIILKNNVGIFHAQYIDFSFLTALLCRQHTA